MSTITPDRSAFDRILGDRGNTLFIVCGAAAGPARAVYEGARRSTQLYPHRHAFITDSLGVFRPAEIAGWPIAADSWVVLGGTVPKKAAGAGACAPLVDVDGIPDMLAIYDAFAKGDAL